ncbi:MAG: Hsp33 family molecular chaperone HslO [Eubacteriales bacterium]|nr:Hsp33 family molecular chaperone HslO [Eubacteriales bacterium]
MSKYADATLLRAIAKNGTARVFVTNSTMIVNEAIRIHYPTPTATAALGRTLTAASMLGSMLKEKSETLTLQIKASGPLKGILAVSDRKGNVRGYVRQSSSKRSPKRQIVN